MFAQLSRSFFRFVLAVQIARPDLKKQAYKPYHYFRLWSRSQNLCYSSHTVKMYFSRRSLQQVNLRALYLNCCPGGDFVKRLIIQAVDLKHQFTNKTLKVSTVQHSKREIEKMNLSNNRCICCWVSLAALDATQMWFTNELMLSRENCCKRLIFNFKYWFKYIMQNWKIKTT